ncbi:hypothetical protein CDD82_366 [Ophiocordyceps australis]|uniref:Armadillo repeat-containing protein 8 n=1 Tax=Ophiocordyceps australis TaxID=1399860 RepID=A0A2C5YLU5_9HYPO|nr:hypothetical protein CDD82_366 [Ophiocordyceps australis]
MAPPLESPILAQLQSAKSFSEQAAALQALKNEVIGHTQKKQAWIAFGVLEPIVLTLYSTRSPKLANDSSTSDADCQLSRRSLTDEDRVKLQALQLVASFASGGPSFLAPLFSAQVVPAVLETNTSPLTNPPQIVVAALRALTEIAEAAALAPESSPLQIASLADAVFSPQHLESLNVLLSISSSSHVLQSQVTLAAGLISRLCRDQRHQHALANAGVLDALAAQLASFAMRDGLVMPGAEERAYSDGLYEVLPEAACATSQIGPILEAITAVIGDSKYRANRLVNSPALLSIFPPVNLDAFRGLQSQYQATSLMDCILPTMPVALLRNYSTPSCPPSPSRSSSTRTLGKSNQHSSGSSVRLPSLTSNGDIIEEEAESPLLPWLIHLVRTLHSHERVLAAAVLASLYRAGLGKKGLREVSIGLLVVPILVALLSKHESSDDLPDAKQRIILEQGPAVLARLMADSEYIQQAAYQCEAVQILARLLKRAYSPVMGHDEPRCWTPYADSMDTESTLPSARLGEGGQNPLMAHRIKLRESCLKAISALAAAEESFRKAFMTEDVVPYVVESLFEFPQKPRQVKDRIKDRADDQNCRKRMTPEYGCNTVPVIIAACHVIRMLSRSVDILRTALVDYAVAMPILQFLSHADVEIRIASTAAMINLVIEASPVRATLTDNGVMRILCEHAHSSSPMLRLNALWALKHFVDAMDLELKKACLEQLEPEWLLQLISDDTQDVAMTTARLTETAEDDVDEDVDMQSCDEPFRWLCGINGAIRELDASRSTRLRQAENRLATIREAELNPVRRALSDDIAIQEQGLDLIRNLIGRPEPGASSDTPSGTTEMIDHVLQQLDKDRLFEILASKLRKRKLQPFSRRSSGPSGEARVLYPQARITAAVIYILVHIAASIPAHRQLVMEQTDMLKLLAQQASSKDREVRVALCHLVINLTWQDDESETHDWAGRTRKLRQLGFHTRMETLKHKDRDLNVRERAKAAVWQMEQATY